MWLRRSHARRPHPPSGTDQGDAEPPSRTPYYNTSAVGMAVGAPCSSPWGSSLPIGAHSPSGSLLPPPGSRAARYGTGVCGDPPGGLLPPHVLPRAVLLQGQLFLCSPSTAGLPKSLYVPHRDPSPSPTGSFIGNFIFFYFFVKGGCLNTAFPG